MEQKIYFLVLAVFTFSAVPVLSLPPNPCPDVFRYVYSEMGEVEGLITLPFDFGESLFIRVNSSMRGFFGKHNSNMRLNLETRAQDLFYKSTVVVKYRLRFPVQQSIPRITQIILNGQVFCVGPPEPMIPGPPVTNMFSTHQFHFTAPRNGIVVGIPEEKNDYVSSAVDYP